VRIKRKISSSQQPLLHDEGELLFKESENSLVIKGVSATYVLGGDGDILSLDTSQQINGDLTITPLLSNSSVDNISLTDTYNPVSVANTKYVKDVFAIIDGGDLDSDIKVGVGSYWYCTNENTTSWFILDNWYTNAELTVHAAQLPDNTTHVVLTGNLAPFVQLENWTQPASINADATGITFNSNSYHVVTCPITSTQYPVVFLGGAGYSEF